MQIESVGQLHGLVRGRRTSLHLSQQAVAARAGVSRKWVSDFERGRVPGAELTLVLRLLTALNLELHAVPHDPQPAAEPAAIDLDAILERHTGP